MWTFIQDQILGMKWLNALIEKLLTAVGLESILESAEACNSFFMT